MAIHAVNWRGEEVPARQLIERYRLTIEPAPPGPAWRVSNLREVHGRASLRVECSGGQLPAGIEWSTVAGLVIPGVRTNETGGVDLTVDANSYYQPAHEAGPHRVKPAGPAERVTGWGLALNLPDGPPPELDNRYQTLAIAWAWGNPDLPVDEPVPATLQYSQILRAVRESIAEMERSLAKLRGAVGAEA